MWENPLFWLKMGKFLSKIEITVLGEAIEHRVIVASIDHHLHLYLVQIEWKWIAGTKFDGFMLR